MTRRQGAERARAAGRWAQAQPLGLSLRLPGGVTSCTAPRPLPSPNANQVQASRRRNVVSFLPVAGQQAA